MTIDTGKLQKVMALLDSPNAGERMAALVATNKVLAAGGKSWHDVSTILTGGLGPHAPVAVPPQANPFGGFDDWMEKQEPGHKARCAAERARQTQEQAAYRAAVIARYGGKDAATKPTEIERTIDAAVAPFMRKEMHTDSRDPTPRTTLDGWWWDGGQISERVVAAMQAALPLPTTIAEAKAEYDIWRERDCELEAIQGRGRDTWLSLGCYLRLHLVTNLLHHCLRAVSIEDALVRQRAIRDDDMPPDENEQDAMLADLEHLARTQTTPISPVQTGHHATATARRAEVERLLSDPATATLPDREIARRVGVSPQTIGNIRRRAGMQGPPQHSQASPP
jgi:hypothetical protein